MQTPTLAGLANALPGSFDNARIVVPDEPAKDEIGAASAVSARLGYNLTGMMLPPVAKASQVDLAPDKRPLILIGLNQPRMPAALRTRIGALPPAQGLAAAANGMVVIAGPTPLGTRIAAEAFAGRTPYLWDLPGKSTSATFADVAADVTSALGGLEPRSTSFDEIVFERGREDASSATITVTLMKGTVPKARLALEALRDRHAQGQDTDTLEYSGVNDLVIRLTDGGATETLTLTRTR